MVKTTDQLLATSLVGAAGEHHCMAQLLLRGCVAALTPQGAPHADILVCSSDGAIAAEVQVKARSGRSGKGWRMSQKNEIARDLMFYCFVDFGQRGFPVYVMPSARVADYLARSHAAWLEAPGRHGKVHNDWAGRFMSPQLPYVVPGFPDGWMKDYRDRWELIIPPVT